MNAFERVLRNIQLLTDAGIRVQIRLNVDKHNIEEMSELVSLLHQRFGVNKRLIIYSRDLYCKRTLEDAEVLFDQRMMLEQQIEELGYRGKQELQKEIKLGLCMADNDQNVVIVPDGHLGKCEHFIDSEFFGHIDSEEKNKEVLCRFKERPADIEACATCPYYPQCFRLKVCEKNDCTPELQKEHIYDIIMAMKDEYEKFLKKQNNDNANDNENQNNNEHETEL